MSTLHVLLISGTVGAGKTTLALKMHDILSNHEIPNSCLDLDHLSYSWPANGPFNSTTVFKALEKVLPVYLETGVQYLILPRVVEQENELHKYSEILNPTSMTLIRVTASEKTRLTRLKSRESGESLKWHLNRTTELEEILQKSALEDHLISNENSPVEETALNVLKLIKWL